MAEEIKKKRESFVIEIGILLKDVLDKQKEIIKEATYDCVKASNYEAGEMIAKKVIQKKLV